NKDIIGVIKAIEENITHINRVKNCLTTSRNKSYWEKLIDVLSTAVQECHLLDHGWDFMEDLEKLNLCSTLSYSYINKEFCVIEDATEINNNELINLYQNLRVL